MILIGIFLPWINVDFLSVSSFERFGVFTLILVMINLIIYFGAKHRYFAVAVATTIIGIIILLNSIGLSVQTNKIPYVAPESGLIMTTVGSIGVILYGITKRGYFIMVTVFLASSTPSE